MLKCLVYITFLWILSLGASAQRLEVTGLTSENKTNPLGVTETHPLLGWNLLSTGRNVIQTAYRVIVASSPEILAENTGDVWDSRERASDSSIQVPYRGAQLVSAGVYYWKVMAWDNRGDSAWSRPASWQMGLMERRDWEGASWLAYDKLPDSERILPGDRYDKKRIRNDVLPLFRKEFRVTKHVARATAFISGLGQFSLYLNGEKVGHEILDPSWTQYDKEADYVTFDVTRQVKKGMNALGVMLGNGFYYVPAVRKRYHKLMVEYGYPSVICLVKIRYTDGSEKNIVTDRSWKTTRGPVVFSSVYGGEDFDARMEQPGWNKPGFRDRGWKSPVVVQGPPVLEARVEDPVRVFEHFKATTSHELSPGAWVFDMGQNAAGIPEITLQGGASGDTVRITPAEVVDSVGRISQRGSGGPSYFTYVLRGNGKVDWHPRFSYYGFRYLEVRGAVPRDRPNPRGLPVIQDIQSLHLRNAAPATGAFSCSGDLFNRIYKLIDWAIQSNMVSLFTDCPHREKLGWLEEVNLMGPSIAYNYDIQGLLRRTILNMKAAQTPEGLVPEIAPEYVKFNKPFRDSPEWGSSAVIVPWDMYRWYGDIRTLDRSYPMMIKYVDYLGGRSEGYLLSYGLSDWYDLGKKRPGFAQLTPMGVTATATYYDDLSIMSQAAAVLGKPEDERRYQALAARVKEAFNDKFYHPLTHSYATGSQTADAMALFMRLVAPGNRQAVEASLIKGIKDRDYALSSGDIGYRYLLKALDEAGASEVIYKMNDRQDVPGYGYQLAHGATALTESWQGYPSVSNDHLMLGDLMEWLYGGMAGIGQTDSSIAYHQVKISPEPVGDIRWCRAEFASPYGKISSDWSRGNGVFNLKVKIPANATAIVEIPASAPQHVSEGGHPVSREPGIRDMGLRDGKDVLELGSGNYQFTAW